MVIFGVGCIEDFLVLIPEFLELISQVEVYLSLLDIMFDFPSFQKKTIDFLASFCIHVLNRCCLKKSKEDSKLEEQGSMCATAVLWFIWCAGDVVCLRLCVSAN